MPRALELFNKPVPPEPVQPEQPPPEAKTEDFSIGRILLTEGVPLLAAALLTSLTGGTGGLAAAGLRTAPRMLALMAQRVPKATEILGAALRGELTLTPLQRTVLEGAVGGLGYGATKQVFEPKDSPLESVADVIQETAWWTGLPVAFTGAWRGAKEAVKLPKTLVQTPIPGLEVVSGGRKTLQEVFQPAVERLDLTQRPAFRRPRMIASRVREGLTGVLNELKAMSPEDRNLLVRFMQTKDPEYLTGGSEALEKTAEKLMTIFTDMEPRSPAQKAIRDAIYEKKVKRVLNPILESFDLNFQEFLKAWEKRPSAQSVQEGLRQIVKDPVLPDNVKEVAMHLYNLPATLIDDYSHAMFRTELDFLKEKILRNPAWHSPVPKPGYIPSKSIEGVYLPRDVELALRDLEYFPRGFSRYANEFLMIPWKLGKVAWNIPVHVRNVMSNIILNDIGGLPFYRVDYYIKALKGMTSHSPEFQEFQKLAGTDFTWAGAELYNVLGPTRIRQISKHPSTTKFVETLLDAIDAVRSTPLYEKAMTVPGALQRLYQAEELLAKFAKYLHNKSQGMTKAAAFEDAMKWTFNYAEVTPAVAWLRATFVPFATWASKVVPLYWQTVSAHPIRALKWPLAAITLGAYSLKESGVTPEEWEQVKKSLPDYLQKGIVVPVFGRDEKGRLQILDISQYLPGFGDTWNLLKGITTLPPTGISGEVRGVIQDPIRNTLISIATNKTSFGAPIYNEWDDPPTQIAKMLWYLWRVWMPTVLGDTVARVSETLKGSETALTPEQHLLRTLGVYLYPVSETQMYAPQLRERAQINDAIRSLRNELIKYPERREQIMEKYMKVFERLSREEVEE